MGVLGRFVTVVANHHVAFDQMLVGGTQKAMNVGHCIFQVGADLYFVHTRIENM